jgi:hypothetical protein
MGYIRRNLKNSEKAAGTGVLRTKNSDFPDFACAFVQKSVQKSLVLLE